MTDSVIKNSLFFAASDIYGGLRECNSSHGLQKLNVNKMHNTLKPIFCTVSAETDTLH